MQKTNTKVSDYIDSLPTESRSDIQKLDEMISKAAPDIKKVMWEGIFWGGSEQKIIGYGEWSYVRKGETLTWFVVGLTQQKNYISVFINGIEGSLYIPEKYASKIGKAKVGKSSIGFKKLSDIDSDVLVDLVKKAFAQ